MWDRDGRPAVGTRAEGARRWIAGEPTAVIMQPTTFCNLDCGYCYLPGRHRKQDMAVDVARSVASGIAPGWPTRGRLEIVWHGGEPLATGRRRLVELLDVFEPLRQVGRIQHVIQTNATLITDEWCDMFAAFDIAVGVSIDGPEPANHNRVDRKGRPAYQRIRCGSSAA